MKIRMSITTKNSRIIYSKMFTKILFAFFFLFSLNLKTNAQDENKKISINIKEINLIDFFKVIQEKSEYDFFYKTKSLPKKHKVTAIKGDYTIIQILDMALNGTKLSYKIIDKDIVILNKTDLSKNENKSYFISGKVFDENKEVLTGVNVYSKSEPTKGVITDFDGNFKINVNSKAPILAFSYIGYKTKQLYIDDETKVLTISLEPDVENIEEVIVTALGIKKEEKMLGYAAQQVGSNELKEGGNTNVISAMQGKIAGVEINTAATGLGGSSMITIRGNSSIAGNNEPLWIVDGVPFNNNGSSSPGNYGGYDRGSSAMDLNMDDIESISVLKGPNAAALYGSLAGNGVIIVTTKRGVKSDNLGIDFSSTISIDKVAETLDFQNKWGRGYDGKIDINSMFSWGAELDGSLQPSWIGKEIPYSAQKNRMKNFFDTGITQNYTLSIGKRDDQRSYRLGTSYLKTKGVIHNQELNRFNIDFSGSSKLSDWMEIESKLSVSENSTRNRTFYGVYGAMNQLLKMPRNIRLKDLKHYSSDERQHINWTGGLPTVELRNPYYVNNQFKNLEVRDRVFGYVNLKFTFNKLFNLSAKQSLDFYHTKFDDKQKDEGITPFGTSNSNYSVENRTFKQVNTEVLATGSKLFNKLDFSYVLGANRVYYSDAGNIPRAKDLYNQDFNLAAGQDKSAVPYQFDNEKEMQSVFASTSFYYNSFINLELTARNDWSSALPSKNNSYFYPSVNLGFIASQLLDNMKVKYPEWITFAKLRASWAQVGKDCEPHQLKNKYRYQRDGEGNIQIIPDSEIRVNENLKPELSTSREFGVDMRFFKDRVGLDFTYYNSFTKNQILKVDEVKSSSYKFKYINAGKIENKGIELAVNLTPVKTKDFRFDLDFNFAHREDFVKELDPKNANSYQSLGENDMIKVIAKTGGKLGEILAKTSYKRDNKGNIIIDKITNHPVILTGKEGEKVIGNIQPDWTGSIRASLKYKNISFSSLFNFKQGGDIVSVSEAIATDAGTAKRTINREDINFKGVIVDAAGVSSPYSIKIPAQKYYRTIGNMGGVAEEFLYDASYGKFSELQISYSFGKKVIGKLPISSLKVSFVGRNLCYLYKHTPGTSPEVGFNLFSQAHDFSSFPYTRNLGFSLNVSF